MKHDVDTRQYAMGCLECTYLVGYYNTIQGTIDAWNLKNKGD